MSGVRVRSEALLAASARLAEAADALRDEAESVGVALARCCSAGRAWGLLGSWLRVEAEGVRVIGPTGLWGAGLALDTLAVRLRMAARGYEEVEDAVGATMAAVRRGADLGARVGWLGEAGAEVGVEGREPRWTPRPLGGPADLVDLGSDLDGGRVRVVELDDGSGGSAWVVAIPGTQEWSPRPGSDPFDLTSDVRAVTGGPPLAAAGVASALDRARSASERAGADDPVLLVGHSQGGILAAALASSPGFTTGHRVTHVVTTGAPVGLFPVPPEVRVLSVEHADDPVPTLDLSPNPSRGSWLTLRMGSGPAADVRRHRLEAYGMSVRAAQDAPRGTVPGLGAWEASAAVFLHRPVRSVTEVLLERGWQNPPT